MSVPLNTSFAHEPENSSDVGTDAAERALVDRIRAGDLDAFEALYRAYWQRLYVFAFRYVHSRIADRLGICEKTVETQLARGLKSLREQIRQTQ